MTTATVHPFHVQLRATRDIPGLGLEPGENLRITFDAEPTGYLHMAYDDCQPGPLTGPELHALAAAAREGALVYATPPSLDELLGVLDAHIDRLTASSALGGYR